MPLPFVVQWKNGDDHDGLQLLLLLLPVFFLVCFLCSACCGLQLLMLLLPVLLCAVYAPLAAGTQGGPYLRDSPCYLSLVLKTI